MADDKKVQPAKVSLAPGTATAAAGTAVAEPDVAALQRMVEALRQEIESLKAPASAPGRVQVEGIFTGASLTLPRPVLEVIGQYEALERALLDPVPAWVFPGSSGPNSPTGAAPTT